MDCKSHGNKNKRRKTGAGKPRGSGAGRSISHPEGRPFYPGNEGQSPQTARTGTSHSIPPLPCECPNIEASSRRGVEGGAPGIKGPPSSRQNDDVGKGRRQREKDNNPQIPLSQWSERELRVWGFRGVSGEEGGSAADIARSSECPIRKAR